MIAAPPPLAEARETVVLEKASVFYGEVIGLSQVDLTVGNGITGIVGPNGCGKSTLMRTLTGLIGPSEGTIRVLGGDPFTDPSVRQRIGLVPATECFYEGLSGRKNLEVAFVSQGWPRNGAKDLASRALEIVGLTSDGDRAYGTWSRGMRQRLKLGLTLAGNAELVLLDEPFLGVDPPSRRHLRNLIEALGAEGRTVLVSSHVLHEIESLTDRVGVLAHGRLLGFGRIGDLVESLKDRNPHRIQLETRSARELASLLVGWDHVREVQIDEGRVEFVTERPDLAYIAIGTLSGQLPEPIEGVRTLDDSLEAVFRHVTAAGSRRL